MNLAHLLTDCVWVADYEEVSDAGEPIYSEPRRVPARVVHEVDRENDSPGESSASQHTIVTECEIPLEARVWLDTDDHDDEAQAHRVVKIKHSRAPTGSTIWQTYV